MRRRDRSLAFAPSPSADEPRIVEHAAPPAIVTEAALGMPGTTARPEERLRALRMARARRLARDDRRDVALTSGTE